MTPTITQLHMQKADTLRAYSLRPSPIARDMIEVPPMPKTVPTAIKIKNTGVTIETAATCNASFVWPTKKVSAKL